MVNTCILLVGLPGSGKTTFSNELIRRNPKFLLIRGDLIRKMLFNYETTNICYNQDYEKSVKEIIINNAKIIMKTKNDFIVDDTYTLNKNREDFIDVVRSMNYKIEIVFFRNFTEAYKSNNRRIFDRVPPEAFNRMSQNIKTIKIKTDKRTNINTIDSYKMFKPVINTLVLWSLVLS